MKKAIKQTVVVLFMVIVLFGSSFAFILGSSLDTFFGGPQQQTNQATPTRFVVSGYLDPGSHDNFLRSGYTLLEFHYQEGCCADLLADIGELPAELEFQLVVQKIVDEKKYFFAESFRDSKEFNATSGLQVLFELCDILAVPPTDCAFKGNVTG